MFINTLSGQLFSLETEIPEDEREHVLAVVDAEPYFEQVTRSSAEAIGRVEGGRFDTTHLSPEQTYRIGRDYIAHALRYGWPMRVVRENVGPGARILEMGAGTELPALRTMLMDHSAVSDYKPAVYVAADLNPFRYRPHVGGVDIRLLDRTNLVTHPERVPADINFDLVFSFEVIEHMDKPDGEKFLDSLFEFAKRKPEREGGKSIILLSTPVNNGLIAKNHIYEWHRHELARAIMKRGGVILAQHGMYANVRDLLSKLSTEEIKIWNKLAKFHSPHMLSCLFASTHPDCARNIAWHIEVG